MLAIAPRMLPAEQTPVCKHFKLHLPLAMEWVDSPLGAFGHVSMPRAPSPEKQRACFCSLNRSGQTYTDAGFKAIWNRPQVEFKSRGGERFHFHDLRAK